MKIIFEIDYRFFTFVGYCRLDNMLPVSPVAHKGIISFRFAFILEDFPRYSLLLENGDHLEDLL